MKILENYLDIYLISTPSPALTQTLEQMTNFIYNGLDQFWKYLNISSANLMDMLKRFIRFIPLAFLNGIYIYSHNSLRGFKKETKRKNLFRSFIAWPFSIMFSFPLEKIFPDVIIGKIASDMIAGFIEGNTKAKNGYRVTKKVMKEMIAEVMENKSKAKSASRKRKIDIMDVMVKWKDGPRGKEALRNIIMQSKYKVNDLKVFFDPLNNREEYEALFKDFKNSEEIIEKFRDIDVDFDFFMAKVRKKLAKIKK